MDPFMVSIDRFIAKAKAAPDLVVQAIAQDALARVKELTPVDTGTLRASWTIVPGGGALPFAGGVRDEQESLAVIVTLNAADGFSLVNPTVYARRIEFGYVGTDKLGRHYDQKGVGMMQQTIAEMPEIAAKAVARVAQQR